MPVYSADERKEEIEALRSQVDILNDVLAEAGDHLELDTHQLVTEWVEHNLALACELETEGQSSIVRPA